MHFVEHLRPGQVVLELRDRLTVETEEQFTSAIRWHLAAGRTSVVLDMAQVPSIDSCGLGALAQASVSAWRRGGQLRLVNVSGRNRRLLAITGLLTALDVETREDEQPAPV
jgi:anti-anti-sigma factor